MKAAHSLSRAKRTHLAHVSQERSVLISLFVLTRTSREGISPYRNDRGRRSGLVQADASDGLAHQRRPQSVLEGVDQLPGYEPRHPLQAAHHQHRVRALLELQQPPTDTKR